MINARGTLTIIGGSMELPEVRAAKAAANQQYVQPRGTRWKRPGKRLAELTGAEWGMVSSGCAAAMSHATAACVAGGNPDLHVRMPDLRGFPSRKSSSRATRATSTMRPSAPSASPSSRPNTPEELRARDRPEDGDDLRLRQPAQRDRPDVARGDRADREAARRADHGRCRSRDPHRPQHPPAARRDAGRLQRRQDPARAAERRRAARPQGPGPGGLDAQRAAPRLRPGDEDRARGSRRDARGDRALGEGRSRRRVGRRG